MKEIVRKFIENSAAIREAFIIEELQSYMDVSNPSKPTWVERVKLRLQEKEDWKREIEDKLCDECLELLD